MRKPSAVLEFVPESSSLRGRMHSSRFVIHSPVLWAIRLTMWMTVPQFHVEPALMGYGTAALVAITLPDGGGRPPGWEEFIGITLPLLANCVIEFYKERNAGNAVKALMDSLAPKAKVERGGTWHEIESVDLVPGDTISFKIRDIVPADCHLTKAINVSIDQAALTGESIPQNKKLGNQCFS